MKRESAWLGIDSLNGRYLTGTDDLQNAIAGPGVIAPKQTANIIVRADLAFTSERLFVARDCARFLIRSVLIGLDRGALAAHSAGIITEPFIVDFENLHKFTADRRSRDGQTIIHIKIEKQAADLLGQPFQLPRLEPYMDLTFQVENIGSTPQRFLGALLGIGEW